MKAIVDEVLIAFAAQHSWRRCLIAAGIRIHYGRNADGTEALVLYAIDASGQELPGLVGTSDQAR